MVRSPEGKRDFATRLTSETLRQLDELVGRGRFRTRTAAIEAAVSRLFSSDCDDLERKQKAFAQACGTLPLGMDSAGWRRAKLDRLEWEGGHHTPPRRRR